MAIISNGTTVASGGNLQAPRLTGNMPAINGSSLTNLPASAPSTSQVLSATASASVGAVGTYAWLRHNNNSSTYTQGQTLAGSNLEYSTGGGNYGGNNPSGTWRAMGVKSTGGNSNFVTLWLRIS